MTLQVPMKLLIAVLNTHLSIYTPYTSIYFPERNSCSQAQNAALHIGDPGR